MSRYKGYAEYKDSGVEWIGNYPSAWELTRVKFESYVKARVGWHGLKSDDFTDEGPYLVTGSDFRGPIIKWEDCYHCDFSRYEQDPYIQLKNDDLLITKDGTIGKVALVSNLNGEATLNSGVFVVRPLEGRYISKFYFWLLHSSVFTGFVDFSKTGSTIVHLYQDTFVNFKFAMPHLIEQEKIANFLDHETAKIYSMIAKQQGLIKLLKEKRQAVISHSVTKGLNPNAPMRDSSVEWLGEVPAHWDHIKIKHILNAIIDAEHKTAEYVDDGVYLVCRTTNVRDGILKLDGGKYTNQETYLEWIKRGVPEPGDILFTREAPAGEACIVPEVPILCLGQRMVLFKLNKFRMNPQFVLYSIYSGLADDFIKQLSQGSTVSHMNMADIINIPLFETALDEQDEIVNHLDRVLARYDELQKNAERAVELIQERRTALISAAVTGKIDVRDWQPAPLPELEDPAA